jgi:hypothetical protein
LRHQSISRQIALVSYGTKFLRKELALEAWCRHAIFSDARFQFYGGADNVLLADDFSQWLSILDKSGATRLSLHLLAEFNPDAPRAKYGDEMAIVVHFPERYQIWAVGETCPARLARPLLDDDASAIDSYWRLEERAGRLAVPATDWLELAAAIGADLDLTMPSSLVPAGPYFGWTTDLSEWVRLPLFPISACTALAHRLLATLEREQAKLANDSHPKNEGNRYQFLDAAGAAALDAWGVRLQSWVLETQLRCANEYRKSDLVESNTPLLRLHSPLPVAPLDAGQVPIPAAPAESVGASGAKPDGKWMRRLLFVLVLAVSCLTILAFANLIAKFPWLSVVIGLPFALYVEYKNKP